MLHKKLYTIAAAAGLCSALFLSTPGPAAERGEVAGEKDRTSYSVGYQIGEDLARQKTPLYADAFLKGVQDALSGAKPQLSPEEMRSALSAMKKKILDQDRAVQAEKQSKRVAEKGKNWAENRDFLAANAKESGVEVLPSGLQYRVLKEGTGRRPGEHDTVLAHYSGTLIDGTEFGSSYRKGEPERRRVDAMIPGMKEAAQLMKEGAKWRLYLPSSLAYGERGPLADRAVIIDFELVSVEASK